MQENDKKNVKNDLFFDFVAKKSVFRLKIGSPKISFSRLFSMFGHESH